MDVKENKNQQNNTQLHCPLCGQIANRQHFQEYPNCRAAAAQVGGLAAGLMRSRAPGGRCGGKRVSYKHRDEMAQQRGESTLKLSFSLSICSAFGLDPNRQTVGELRNAVLAALDLPAMGVRGDVTINQRFHADRLQLDFRRTDVALLWSRFNLPKGREDSLNILSNAIENYLFAKTRR